MYVDSAGNEVRLPVGAEWPEQVDIIPIWTKDHVDQIVEWTNVDPAELFFYCDPEWSEEGAGWVRAEHDYDVNLKAELEIELLHQKLDLLREEEIGRLIQIIERLEARLSNSPTDKKRK